MSIRHFIVFLLMLSATYASNFGDEVNEGSSCEDKISAALSVLKTEIYRKLDAMDIRVLENLEAINRKLDASDKNIPAKLDDLENKLTILGKTNKALDEKREEALHDKLHKQEKNILEKLEEYIDEKLDSSEKHMYRKIDALDKFMADKTDVNVINHKLDALKNKDEALENETLRIANEEINKFEKYNTSEKENNITCFELDALNNKITNLEYNLKCELQRILPNVEENIKRAVNNTLTQFINHTLFDIQKNNPVEFENSRKKKILPNIQGYWDCKKREVTNYDYKLIRMDNENLNYVTLESDSEGLTHFEMRFALKSLCYNIIQLSPVLNPKKDDGFFAVDIGYGYQKSAVVITEPNSDDSNTHKITTLQTFDTPNIFSNNKFTAFSIRINNRTLELVKTGTDLPPILTYTDSRFRFVKYIGLTQGGNCTTTIFYDCPPHHEETFIQ